MKKRCKSCGKKYGNKEEFCPHCGAYQSEAGEYTAHPVDESYNPPFEEVEEVFDTFFQQTRRTTKRPVTETGQTQPKQLPRTRSTAMVPAVLIVVVLLILIPIVSRSNQPSGSGAQAGREPAASTTAVSTMTVEEQYRYIEDFPRDFDAVNNLIEVLCERGRSSEAADVLLNLYRRNCGDAAVFRRAGELLHNARNENYAVRAYLTAYTISGLQSDLDLATECGSPADIIATGPTTQALEFFFNMPLSRVTWEEVGLIKTFVMDSDTVSFSLYDPLEVDPLERDDVLQTFEIDGGTVSASYLYGLVDLSFNRSFQWNDVQLCALRSLRVLRLPNAYGLEDLESLSVLPSLEELTVGGSALASLDGLDHLTNLHTLGLEGTSLDNLSNLASYKNIEHLFLKNNKQLDGLNSLGQMDHLKTLSVERQEVMDFYFLQKFYAIEGLSLDNTAIKDIYFLEELTTLKQLKLVNNDDLLSVAGIGALERLEDLTLACNKMEGVEEIAHLTNLTALELRSPRDLNMISGLANLETLHIYGSGLLDSIAPIANCTNLRSFSIGAFGSAANSYYYSLEPLTRLPNLTHVSLPNSSFYGNSSSVFNISTLEYLNLTGSRAEVGSAGLSGLTGIRNLRLGGFKGIYNVQVYSDGFFTSIDYDNYDADRLVSSLSGLQHLEQLELPGMGITDVAFVGELPSLKNINLAGNYVVDVEPIGDSGSLQYVNLAGNPVRDWSVVDGWTGIRVERK